MRRKDERRQRDTRGGAVAGLDRSRGMDPNRHGQVSRLPSRDPLVHHTWRATITDQPGWPLTLRDVPRGGHIQGPADEPWAQAIAAGLGALAAAVALVVFLTLTSIPPS